MESNVGRVLDMRNQKLKRIPRNIASEPDASAVEIKLDNNELTKFEFMSGFHSVKKFTATNNFLFRMYSLSGFKHLVHLDLSNNRLLCIEGLREMPHLAYLNLANNGIKVIDHNLNKNVNLEYLNVSGNALTEISNLSHLIKLKTLLFHSNLITTLKYSELYLPKSLETLTLAQNKISDLCEVGRLVELTNLKEISFADNPCVQMTGDSPGFNYRPFLLNWVLSLKVIDGFAINDLECLKAEWLYSQGRGRQFRPGEHKALIQYLATASYLTDDKLHSEPERKLQLILRKAKEHGAPLHPHIGSCGKTSSHITPQIMSRSLDPSIFQKSVQEEKPAGSALSRSLHCGSVSHTSEKEVTKPEVPCAPLPAASKLVPVPESLISPMVANVPDIPMVAPTRKQSTEGVSPNEIPSSSKLVVAADESYAPIEDKLMAIRTIAEEMRVKKSQSCERASKQEPHAAVSSSTLSTESFHTVKKVDTSSSLESSLSHSLPQEYLDLLVRDDKKKFVAQPPLDIIKAREGETTPSSHSSSSLVAPSSLPSSTKDDETAKNINNIVNLYEKERAAVCIQKIWRGYRVRSKKLHDEIKGQRINNHIQKLQTEVNELQERLATEMASMKEFLERERKLQVLHFRAISVFWNKLSSMETNSAEDNKKLDELSKMCERLRQEMPQPRPTSSEGTQTDITAVHSDDDSFPYHRPSSLPITTYNEPEIPPESEETSQTEEIEETEQTERNKESCDEEK